MKRKIKIIKRFLSLLFGLIVFFTCTLSNAQDGSPVFPGITSGTGTYFEITDSDYLNITVESTEEITLRMESIPETILIHFKSAASGSSTQITLGGFEPLTTYYMYEDGFQRGFTVTTDGSGYITYTQDISQNHVVVIKPGPSTIFITDNSTGGDCELKSIGVWEWSTKTCTLIADVYETIEITSDGVTLDGAGYTVQGSGYSIWIQGQEGVTIKNVQSIGTVYSVSLHYSDSNTVTGNVISCSDDGYGIYLFHSSANTVTGNTITGCDHGGIFLNENSNNNTATGNTLTGEGDTGVILNCSSTFNSFIGNSISDKYYGFMVVNHSSNNILAKNTISSNTFGMFFAFCDDSEVYNNNFIDNSEHDVYAVLSNNIFNLDLPDGGNYWCNCTGVDENGDNIFDDPYSFYGGVDNYPWTLQDAWEDREGPLSCSLLVDTNPAAVDTPVVLTATVDDTGSGGADIAAAQYNFNNEGWVFMGPADAFDSPTEDVVSHFMTPFTAGVYDICVRGTDALGNTGDPECTLLIVYDQYGGYVTGGGWIFSAENAYVPDSSRTGKASFGFVSKYRKGAAVPTGYTEFQFHAAGLDFYADTYDWMVVTGSNFARFKGVGSLNDEENYKFQLWAGDATGPEGTDTFRIKIWTEDEYTEEETVIYDNLSDQAIGGGSIVIQLKKKK